MLGFRSEAHVDRWCRRSGVPKRPIVTLEQQWQLAVIWYGNRLTPESRRPGPSEIPVIFASLGLTGDFWDLS
jgi:hypothetical protein